MKILWAIISFLVTVAILNFKINNSNNIQINFVPNTPPSQTQPIIQNQNIVNLKWKTYKKLRQPDSRLGQVLSDIDSHLPAGHIYADQDRITHGHESSHGIAAQLRMKFAVKDKRINGFYCLNDQVVIIEEPDTTISAVAQLVPRSLRGQVYNLYLIQQTRHWNNIPLYIFDEWIAYSNGAAVRADLGIIQRQETVQYMLEFNNYAICLAWKTQSTDEQFKSFLKYSLERSMQLYKENLNIGDLTQSTEFVTKTQTSPDAEAMRSFARSYLGEDWCQRVLGY